ncbi:MAG: ATP-dependent DNA helicase RecQ [Phycisphaerales bacterium]|nr:ATP-dependent DNA helicase RecQ [Phycisphaerales bacterium]
MRERVREVVKSVWGFDALRPLQQEAIDASLAGRDSLVVMPTGGGKSLCYQVPPLVSGRLCVVISPLIALMNDQVAGLEMAGYPAAALHGHVGEAESGAIRRRAEAGELRLLLAAPERALSAGFISWLKRLETRGAGAGVESFAIDEAHCISQWGHDFRPEYRRLAELRRHFPGAPLHAYTATATERVREDIVEQLGLRNPAVLVGRFDRSNLTYRVAPRVRLEDQAVEALRRHEGRGAIVYCISRRDTESMASSLQRAGIDARAYHAGMDARSRLRAQEDFKNERLNVVVATVAFGMGIDRGDVRLVLHAAMPKTIEHYQQETGRAGRDGLASECVLLYSASDAVRWRQLMERGAAEAEDPEAAADALGAQWELLAGMQSFASGACCRHTAISE